MTQAGVPVALREACVEAPQGRLHLLPLHLEQLQPVHCLAQRLRRDAEVALERVALRNQRRVLPTRHLLLRLRPRPPSTTNPNRNRTFPRPTTTWCAFPAPPA